MADINNVFGEGPTVHQQSQESVTSRLNLFQLAPTDVSTLQGVEYVPFYPRIPIKEEFNPLDIIVQFPDTASYLDLANSFLKMNCRVVMQDGKKCTEGDKVAPCSLAMQAIWRQLEVSLNGQLISDSNNYYPYISYLNRFLTTSEETKKTVLKDEFYYPNDEFNKYETDKGFLARYEMTKESGVLHVAGNILCNIFNQSRYLPGGSEIRILMRRGDPAFYLDCKDTTKAPYSGTAYRIQIEECIFYAAKRLVLPKIVSMHRDLMSKGHSMKYPTNEVQVRSFGIAQNLRHFESDSIILGKCPGLVVFGLVPTTSFLGDITKSPFEFVQENLSELSFTFNGEPVEFRSFPFYFKPDTAKGTSDILLPLRSLRKTAGSELGNGLNRDNYEKGNCLLAVEFLPTSGAALAINKKGSVKVSVKFGSPTTQNLTAIVLCMYQAIIEIHPDKTVSIN